MDEIRAAGWEGLEVFFGDANNAEARIYARLASLAPPEGAKLSGRVVGPQCAYAQTLPAAIRLMAKRSPPGEAATADLLAEAIVPDPCFWSPELPFLYRVEVELRQADHLLGATERMLGLRPLGVRARRLLQAGRPWVVRAVGRAASPPAELDAWRAADLAMLVDAPDDALCEAASRRGAWLLARIGGTAEQLTAELGRLARWPCVALAVLEATAESPNFEARRPKNLLLAQYFSPGAAIDPAAWAAAIVCEDADPGRLAQRCSNCDWPAIAASGGRWHDDLDAARRACDDLQRALAGRGEFAGYLA